MTFILTARIARAAAVAALLVVIGACADVPSSPTRQLPTPWQPDQPILRVADVPLLDASLPRPLLGESRQRRIARAANGQLLQVESLIGTDGRPRITLVRRDGVALLRIDNTWSSVSGWEPVSQHLIMRGADGVVRALDSRSVLPTELAAARENLRLEAQRMATPRVASRVRGLEEDAGVCDAQVKAADIATWQYAAAAFAVIASGITGNQVIITAAFTGYLAAYANYESKQAELDKCVVAAGKRPEVDEF